nr:oligopeptide transporter 3 [Tanacetum cinerariifolium]
MLRRYLVDPVEMWWPANLAQVSLFRALHEKETKADAVFHDFPRPEFCILLASWLPFPHLDILLMGLLGLAAQHNCTTNWLRIPWSWRRPLVTPWTSTVNVGAGFIMFIYIIVPVCYWKYNTLYAHKFPIFSNKLFTRTGHVYDTTRILTPQFDLNEAAYDSYSKLYLSPLFALSILDQDLLARFTATLTHVALFHGGDIWKQSKSAVQNAKIDIHAKLMKSYKQVPQWWYLVLLFGNIILSLVMCFVWNEDVQLPWWGFLFAFALAFIVTLPIGVIQPTTNQVRYCYEDFFIHMSAQFIFGYMLPGKPITNLLFKIYGRISTVHPLSFLSDLKLGHYMKIPPRCMFTAQVCFVAFNQLFVV